MKTFVGLASALIMSGGVGLLLYLTFRGGGLKNPSRHVRTNEVTEAADGNGEESTPGSRPLLGGQPGQADKDQVADQTSP